MALTPAQKKQLTAIDQCKRELERTFENLRKREAQLLGVDYLSKAPVVEHAQTDTSRNASHPALQPGQHAELVQTCHDHIAAASDGRACAKAGAAFSAERLGHLAQAADAMHRLGAKCAKAEEEGQGTRGGQGRDQGGAGDKETASRPGAFSKSAMAWDIEGDLMGRQLKERMAENERIAAARRKGLI